MSCSRTRAPPSPSRCESAAAGHFRPLHTHAPCGPVRKPAGKRLPGKGAPSQADNHEAVTVPENKAGALLEVRKGVTGCGTTKSISDNTSEEVHTGFKTRAPALCTGALVFCRGDGGPLIQNSPSPDKAVATSGAKAKGGFQKGERGHCGRFSPTSISPSGSVGRLSV